MMRDRPCGDPGCKRPARTRGFCQSHYAQRSDDGRLVPLQVRERDDRLNVYESTDGECMRGCTPCTETRCRYHLAEYTALGARVNPGLAEPCALRLGDRGGMTLEEVGAAFGVSRERVRQIERRGLIRLAKKLALVGWPAADVRAALAAAAAEPVLS